MRAEPPESAAPEWFKTELGSAEECVRNNQQSMRLQVKKILKIAAENGPVTLELKKEFARRVQRLLNLAEHRIACPVCGDPSTLHAANARGVKDGVFQFVHVQPKRTVHGGLPQLPAGLNVVPTRQPNRANG